MNCEADYERIHHRKKTTPDSGWTAGWPRPSPSSPRRWPRSTSASSGEGQWEGSQRDVRLQLGDILQLYINDEFFEQPREENAFLSVFKPHLTSSMRMKT